MRNVHAPLVLLASSLLIGCGASDRNGDLFGDAPGAGEDNGADDDGADGDGTADDDGGDGSGDDGDDGGVKFDTPDGESGEGDGSCDPEVDPDCRCDAVDILFVVDNSVSMGSYQESLANSFPKFADAVMDVLAPDTSLHVGITTTEFKWLNDNFAQCGQPGEGDPWEAYFTPEQGDTGVNGAQGRLWEHEGKRFYDIDTSAPAAEVEALDQWFSAAALVGEEGSNLELSSAAAAWAVDPANEATNDGFLRDEGAVFVLFFVQDESDYTPEDSQVLIDKLAAAKSGCGGLDCIVGGGLINAGCLPYAPLGDLLGSLGAPPVIEDLPYGDSSELFDQVLRDTLSAVIAQKCEEIAPPQG
jgi:hypothetical protein